ncbi:MAG: Hsp20/alpha crystallin family protein [Chloroflexota bacterium]
MVNYDELQRQMERYLAHFNRAGKRATILFTASAQPTPAWSPTLDMYETQDCIVVLLDLAGVEAEKTEVHIQPHLLTVRGLRHERHARCAANEQRSYHALEIPYGRFERSVPLPPGTDTDAARANYRDGLLEITLPKRLSSRIPISLDDPLRANRARP